MDRPEQYVKNNGLQKRDAVEVISKYVEKMTWTPNEIVLDIGCGPGDVTSNVLYQLLKNRIKQIIGVDKSEEMVKYAIQNYRSSTVDFNVLDIENVDDCVNFEDSFDKIFSFFCFHWIQNKVNALINVHLMLKHGGEVLINFLLVNPLVELYKLLDDEWKIYVKGIPLMPQEAYSYDNIKSIFSKAGFRIIYVESNVKSYTFPNFESVLNATKAVDAMYKILPPHLHDKYSAHVKDKIYKKDIVKICEETGQAISSYIPITVHAIKD